MTRDELSQGLFYCAAAYGTELTEEMLAVFFDQLGRANGELFTQACREFVAKSQKFPTPADLRQAMNRIVERRGDPRQKRMLAESRLIHDARKSGKSPDQVAALIEKIESKHNLGEA